MHHLAAVATQVTREDPGGEHLAVHARQSALQPGGFASSPGILDHCALVWNAPVEQPWTVMSIGLRGWMHR